VRLGASKGAAALDGRPLAGVTDADAHERLLAGHFQNAVGPFRQEFGAIVARTKRNPGSKKKVERVNFL
jgi:hypothetical protein